MIRAKTFVISTSIGIVDISSQLQLDHVFYIPSFKFNLLSITQLTKSHSYSITFFNNSCIFWELFVKKTIGVDNAHGGLYYFQSSCAHLVIGTPTIDLSHWQLGHPSSQCQLAKDFPFISYSNKSICDICPQAKQTQLSFPDSSISSNKPFQLIHCDISDSFSQPSLTGARFFLTMVDDFSCCKWILCALSLTLSKI